MISTKRKLEMRREASNLFELTKGFTHEPNNEAMKVAIEMANYVLILTSDLSNWIDIKRSISPYTQTYVKVKFKDNSQDVAYFDSDERFYKLFKGGQSLDITDSITEWLPFP